ncbi:hypothetical protein JTE90_015762 [Oedothorax gibbosus]|uniref:Uncharacterized protein n=1 Tax=Oedothorax gibbosus TaxID=931172 RepID=A0AAV6VXN4_9ARAC|nr:hypothetical protein JTE90_015762 [Oedothorax gibbosus]
MPLGRDGDWLTVPRIFNQGQDVSDISGSGLAWTKGLWIICQREYVWHRKVDSPGAISNEEARMEMGRGAITHY